MKFNINQQTFIPEDITSIPGTINAIGCSNAGLILETSQLTAESALRLAIKMASYGFGVVCMEIFDNWRVLTLEPMSADHICKRCCNLGMIEKYRHIDDGQCFACECYKNIRILDAVEPIPF